MLAFNVDAHEKIYTSIDNIPGAYLSTDIDNISDMVLQGELEELITQIYTGLYRNCVVVDSNGKMILWVKLQNYLYR